MSNDKKQTPINLMVVLGSSGKALSLTDILQNKPEAVAAIDEWLAKKQKAFKAAEKRKTKQRIYNRKP